MGPQAVGRVKDLLHVLGRRSGDDRFADDLENAQAKLNTASDIDGDPWERLIDTSLFVAFELDVMPIIPVDSADHGSMRLTPAR